MAMASLGNGCVVVDNEAIIFTSDSEPDSSSPDSNDFAEKMNKTVTPILNALRFSCHISQSDIDVEEVLFEDKIDLAEVAAGDNVCPNIDLKKRAGSDFSSELEIVCKNLYRKNYAWIKKKFPGDGLVRFVGKLCVQTADWEDSQPRLSTSLVIRDLLKAELLTMTQVIQALKIAFTSLPDESQEYAEKGTTDFFALFLFALFQSEEDFSWLVHLGDLGAKENTELWKILVSRIMFLAKRELSPEIVQEILNNTPNSSQLPINTKIQNEDENDETISTIVDLMKVIPGNLDQKSPSPGQSPPTCLSKVRPPNGSMVIDAQQPAIRVPIQLLKTVKRPEKKTIRFTQPSTSKATTERTASISTQTQISPPPTPVPPPQEQKVRFHYLALPPIPPNWEASCNEAIQSLTPYTRVAVPKESHEYRTLAGIIENCVTITKLERIVNVDTWRRFTNMRTEMLLQKSDDMKLLEALGLSDEELIRRAHILFNFQKEKCLQSVPYSENMALLFHCSRGTSSIEDILSQGLDERLGNGGSLGKGIYFADYPNKAIGYDQNSTLLIFGVLLGDCFNVSNSPSTNRQGLVREPKKSPEQQRSPTDLFFDSIVGRPDGHTNEYVIFNRNQCCPLYSVAYTRKVGVNAAAAPGTPPFAWSTSQISQKTRISVIMPLTTGKDWSLLANVVFDKMAGDRKELGPAQLRHVPRSRSVPTFSSLPVQSTSRPSPESIAKQLQELREFGFMDSAKNTVLLEIFNYNFEQTLDSLLDGATLEQSEILKLSAINEKQFAKELKIRSAVPSQNGAAKSRTDSDPDDCLICMQAYPKGRNYWKSLTCKHEVCNQCYKYLEKTGTTMSGQSHVFVKCPFCMASSGIEIGSCPNGTMTVTEIPGQAPGYEKYNTLQIQYVCPGSPGLNRTAYVPNSPEGKEVVALLKQAWDRRLCFSVGTSVTTGQSNVCVWNIHHKSSLTGGVQSYGYPDPTYLTRVKEELRKHGIV